MKQEGISIMYRKIPLVILMVTLLYLLFMYTFVYLIDFKMNNIFGIITWLETEYPCCPFFWIYGFREASPTEHLQWYFLSVSMIITAFYIISKARITQKVPWAWVFLLTGLTIMFYEDMQNLRHQAVNHVASLLDVSASTMVFFDLINLRSSVELIIYLVLGSLMLLALYLILQSNEESPAAKRHLIGGYIFYGIASVFSATRSIGSWYENFGRALLGDSLLEEMNMRIAFGPYQDRLGFHFVDFVLEESLELMGAAFISAALATFLIKYETGSTCPKNLKIYGCILLIYTIVFWISFKGIPLLYQ